MSKKKKRNKNRNKNKKKQKPVVEEPINKGRRNFLKLGAGLLAVGTAAYFGLNPFSSDEWAFLERSNDDIKAHMYNWYDVESNLTPLIIFGSKIIGAHYHLGGKKTLESIYQQIDAELISKGYTSLKNAPYNLTLFVTYYGSPSKQRFVNSTIDYCKKANDFVHKKIPNLDKRDLKFVGLKQGEDYTKDFNNTIFIGDNFYELQEVKAVNKQNPEQETLIKRAVSCKGAFCQFNTDKEGNAAKEAYIFIPAYDLALLSAFSETIHLITKKRSADCYGEGIESQIVDEAIAEGLSNVLSCELVDKLNIPDGRKIINNLNKTIFDKPMYKYVPASIRWIEKNGIQKAFDIYMENPEKFMKLIKS